MTVQKCKIIQAFGHEQLERMINAWIAEGQVPYEGPGRYGNYRFIYDVSYQKDGIFDRALIIYEDQKVRGKDDY